MEDKNTYWIHPDSIYVLLSSLRIRAAQAKENGDTLAVNECTQVYNQLREQVDAKFPGWIKSPTLENF